MRTQTRAHAWRWTTAVTSGIPRWRHKQAWRTTATTANRSTPSTACWKNSATAPRCWTRLCNGASRTEPATWATAGRARWLHPRKASPSPVWASGCSFTTSRASPWGPLWSAPAASTRAIWRFTSKLPWTARGWAGVSRPDRWSWVRSSRTVGLSTPRRGPPPRVVPLGGVASLRPMWPRDLSRIMTAARRTLCPLGWVRPRTVTPGDLGPPVSRETERSINSGLRMLSKGLLRPVSGRLAHPISSDPGHPISRDQLRPISERSAHPISKGLPQPICSDPGHPISRDHLRPISGHLAHPISSDPRPPVSSGLHISQIITRLTRKLAQPISARLAHPISSCLRRLISRSCCRYKWAKGPRCPTASQQWRRYITQGRRRPAARLGWGPPPLGEAVEGGGAPVPQAACLAVAPKWSCCPREVPPQRVECARHPKCTPVPPSHPSPRLCTPAPRPRPSCSWLPRTCRRTDREMRFQDVMSSIRRAVGKERRSTASRRAQRMVSLHWIQPTWRITWGTQDPRARSESLKMSPMSAPWRVLSRLRSLSSPTCTKPSKARATTSPVGARWCLWSDCLGCRLQMCPKRSPSTTPRPWRPASSATARTRCTWLAPCPRGSWTGPRAAPLSANRALLFWTSLSSACWLVAEQVASRLLSLCFIHLSIHPFIHPSIHPSHCPSPHPSFHYPSTPSSWQSR